MAERVRWTALRTAWLMIGAAIGLSASLLGTGAAQVLVPIGGAGGAALTVACLLPALLIGLLPGVRELEVTAARSMLGVTGEVVVPERPSAEHRVWTVAVVAVHLVLGLLAAIGLVGVLPGVVVLVVASVRGNEVLLASASVPPVAPALSVLLGALATTGVLLAVRLLGRLATVVVARLLAPTAADRLAVAVARLAAEAEQNRLARELHDGIGHALTIIGVQAAAGRRLLAGDPDGVVAALGAIEGTARQAVHELDGVLAVLRDRRAPVPDTEPDLRWLPALVQRYRSAGLDLVATVHEPGPLPRAVSTAAYRVVAEALANAQKHGGPGPVLIGVERVDDRLAIVAANALPEGAPETSGRGHGLRGVAERAALVGGTAEAGAATGRWVLRASLPADGPR